MTFGRYHLRPIDIKVREGYQTSPATAQAYAAMRIQFWTHPGAFPSVFEPKVPIVNSSCTVPHVSLVSLLTLTTCFAGINAVNLTQCGQRLQAAQEGTLNTTSGMSPAPVLSLSYAECIIECGGGLGMSVGMHSHRALEHGSFHGSPWGSKSHLERNVCGISMLCCLPQNP